MNVVTGTFNAPTKRATEQASVSSDLPVRDFAGSWHGKPLEINEEAGAAGRPYNGLLPLTGDALHAYQCSAPSMTVDSPKDPNWQPDRNSDFIICYRSCASQQTHDVWIGEQSVPATSQIGQRTQILNLTDEYNTEQLSELGWVRFNLKPNVSNMPERHSDGEFGHSKADIDGTIHDPTISSLASTLRLAHDTSGKTNLWLTDSVARILHVYFSRTYGKLRERRNRYSSLAPWQERRAKELMGQDLSQDISIKDLAKECEISPSHFCRAFSTSTGLSPRQWLLATRVERARDLLTETKMPLAEIAIACGFFDQSHLTKIFSRAIGSTPGAWRRAHRI
jgi:AraC family transcriptional regulator